MKTLTKTVSDSYPIVNRDRSAVKFGFLVFLEESSNIVMLLILCIEIVFGY